MLSRAQLEERYPNLRGKLDPPEADGPPPGVEVREEGGARVVTVNVRGAVPTHAPSEDREHEDVQALRDVAAYVRSIDADVVMVNELRQGTDPDQDGVQRQADVLYHLLEADSVVYGGRYEPGSSKKFGGDMNLGNAVFTRNGYQIDAAANVDLQNSDVITRDDTSVRAQLGDVLFGGNTTEEHRVVFQNNTALVASVVEPDGGSFSVVSTHINSVGGKASDGKAYREVAEGIRANQLGRIEDIVDQIRTGGEFDYRTPISVDQAEASGFGADAVIVAGDFNTSTATLDDAWEGAGIANGWGFLPEAEAEAAGASDATYLPNPDSAPIDHVYVAGGSTTAGGRGAIEFSGSGGGYANDHAAIHFDVDTEGD